MIKLVRREGVARSTNSSRTARAGLAVLVTSFTLGCSATDDGTTPPASENPPQSAVPLKGLSSRETSTHMENTFPVDRGDVRAAYARAKSRLGRQLNETPNATGTLAPDTAAPAAAAASGTLVLYDVTGPWGWLGELYALNIGSLVSHFGVWTAKPASKYVANELSSYAATIYVGSTFDEPLPASLLDDIAKSVQPVVWMDNNIWQLQARAPNFATTYGFQPWIFDTSTVSEVDYKGIALTRYAANGAGIMSYTGQTTAQVLAQAVHTAGGTKVPWAVRGKNLTYIGENPMAYVTSDDRYLAFCDLLFDALAPATPERHRALVRIEDVGPKTSPNELRAIADYLASEKIPFGIATIPYYTDPTGFYNGGRRESLPMMLAPATSQAIRYMTQKGGTVVMHGYTHQYATKNNPYDAVTADDFEFYTAHIDASNYVIYDGPVPGDSRAWANSRIASAFTQFTLSLLPRPSIFEFPHYAGSAADSLAVRDNFTTVYHRGLYFGGLLAGTTPNYTHPIGIMYPFTARDIYGLNVIPETLGSYEPDASNNNPPRLVADILKTAHSNRVVRDGFASFYFHPYYDLAVLKQIVAGIKAEGYSFVSPATL